MGWLLLGAWALLLTYLCLHNRWFSLLVVTMATWAWVAHATERRRQRRLAFQRRSESICTFARSFDLRRTDTWVLRAAFEETGQFVSFPVRAGDRLRQDLGLDDDDVAELAESIADRAGRMLDERDAAVTPVRTVRDLVEFFLRQPRLR